MDTNVPCDGHQVNSSLKCDRCCCTALLVVYRECWTDGYTAAVYVVAWVLLKKDETYTSCLVPGTQCGLQSSRGCSFYDDTHANSRAHKITVRGFHKAKTLMC